MASPEPSAPRNDPGLLIDGLTGWADPNVGGFGRAASAFAVLYAVSPIDLVPDVALPVVGLLDDAAVILLAGKIVQMQRRS